MGTRGETKENTELEGDYDEDDIIFVSEKKGTRRLLTLSEKIDVIEHYKMHKNTRSLANKYQCGISQIRRILRHKEKLLDDWKNKANLKRLKRGPTDEMKYHRLVMHEWLRRCQCYPIKLTDNYIREKALHVKKVIKMPSDFRTDKGWLKAFISKFELNQKELLSNDINYKKDEPQKSLNIEDIINDKTFKDHVLEISKKKSNGKKKVSNDINLNKSGVKNIDVVTVTTEVSLKENLSSVLNVSEETIKDYKDAVRFLQPLEEFALFKGNVRAVGLINQLEVFYRDEIVGNSSKAKEDCLLTVEKPKSKDIQNFGEAKLYLWPLQQFSVAKGNLNAVALVNILDNIFGEESLTADKL